MFPIEPTLTVVNICAAMNLVIRNVRGAWLSAGVPNPILDEVGLRASTLKECNRLCAIHYINYSPKASWQHISGVLFSRGEIAAVNKIVPFLPPKGEHVGQWYVALNTGGFYLMHTHQDHTLTLASLSLALKEVPDSKWNEILRRLRLPDSVQEEIQVAYRTDAQRKEAVLDNYVNKHPCPSWTHVTRVLRGMELYKLASEVIKQYVSAGKQFSYHHNMQFVIIA